MLDIMIKRKKSFKILLIEDNPGDIRLTKEAFKEGKSDIQLIAVTDGVKAIQYLNKEDPFSDATTPDIILLDLNLPKKDGRQVLQEVKSDLNLRRIPIIVLTTSNAETDIIKSYNLHANCYINKPVDYDSFYTIIKNIEEFWLSTVILPSTI